MERVYAQCCCIPYIVIKIFDCNCNDLELSRFKVLQGQRSLSQSKVCWLFPIWPPLYPTSYLAPYSRYLMLKSRNLELGRFKVIQGQRWWCQSIAHRWFPIRLLLTTSSYHHRFRNICVISMTLDSEGSRSSEVKGHSTNRKPMGGFLSDLLWVQHRISHRIRDIWCQSPVTLN